MRRWFLATLLLIAGAPGAGAHGEDCHAAASDETPAPGGLRLEVPDVTVLDQDGRQRRFYRDLVQGRVVVISFIYTTCTTICPVVGAHQMKLREQLAGEDVQLISITLDPTTDTPRRLKAWGQKFHVGKGWTLVTGGKEAITRLLKSLGAFAPDRTRHGPLLLVGNERAGVWRRASGFAPAAQVIEVINDVRKQ